jgi:hypothetical protein
MQERSRYYRLAVSVLAAGIAAHIALAADAVTATAVNIDTTAPSPLPAGFSGFNVPQLRNGVEYYDPKFVAATASLLPGSLRFPAGTASLAFDWQAGHIDTDWLDYLTLSIPPLVDSGTAGILNTAQKLTQAKGGVFLSDFATFANTFGSPVIICFNGYTDNNPSSATQMAQAAQSYGLNVEEWELANEPYLYPMIFPTADSYAASMFNPYYSDIVSVAPTATAGLFSEGLFPGVQVNNPVWDTVLSTYTPSYWNASSVHVYPIVGTLTTQETWEKLNGILAHGTADYINSYLLPLIGAQTPVYITEFNCCKQDSNPYLTYLYNGVFLAEYMARMSSVPNVKAVGVNSLYTDNYDSHGLIRAVNDFQNYLVAQVTANPNYSTDTATDPNTQFQFYTSAPGLAMAVANQAINSSSQLWPTTLTGGPTVPIIGYDGNPVPAIYAQAYLGNNGSHYLLITNKAAQSLPVRIQVNGVNVTGTLSLTYVSNTSGQAANTAQSPSAVRIQTSTSSNPVSVGPNSVTCVTW